MARLEIRLFGAFHVLVNGQPLHAFESDKVRALLAYLVVESAGAHRREKLVGLLWPDRMERSARTSLRGALADLRRAIGDREARPPCLFITRQAVQLNHDADVWVDAAAFGRLLSAQAVGANPQEPGDTDPKQVIHFLEDAITLYRGSFLEGFSIPDAAPFEEWTLLKREGYQRQMVETLGRLSRSYATLGDYDAALRPARRQVELDPWNEKGHRNLMRMLAAGGQRGPALAQFEVCRALLAEGVGAEPANATQELYEAIKTGAFSAPDALPVRPTSLPSSVSRPELQQEDVAPSQTQLPLFVGREPQLERLFGWLNGALSGHTRIAFVIGGPGRGKTALMEAFAYQAMEQHPDLVVAAGHCNAYAGIGDPYLPFQMILGQLTGDLEAHRAPSAIQREHVMRMWHALPLTAQAIVDHGPDLIDTIIPSSDLLGRVAAFCNDSDANLPCFTALRGLIERRAASAPSSNLQQGALFRQFGQVLDAVAQRRPLLLLVDDLQWTDLGSASLLLHLARGLSSTRIFLVGAYRAEELAAPHPAAAYGGPATHPLQDLLPEVKRLFGDVWIDLSRTDPAQDRHFVDALLDSQPNCLDDAFRATFYRHTQGHPLFCLELLRAMRDRGDLKQDIAGRWMASGTLAWQELPPQVEGVIEQRVSRVGRELREVLDIASVQGEEFTAQVIARVQGVDERAVIRELATDLEARHRLVAAQGLSRLGERTLSQHRFCHNLFQKYLYQSLSRAERIYQHREVGSALEDLYREHPGALAALAPQLARHYREAGVTDKAIYFLNLAGKRATGLSANQEAVAHFAQALELLKTLPDTPQRAEQELMLLVGMLIPLQVNEGYGTPRIAQALARARELCEMLEGSPQLFQVLYVLQVFHAVRAEYSLAHEVGEQLLNLAERIDDPLLELIAHADLGYPLLLRGELAQALAHFQRGIDTYHPDDHHELASRFGADFGVTCRAWASQGLWFLGYPDQALRLSQEALNLAQKLAHPTSLAFAQDIAGCHFYHFYGDRQKCRAWAEKCIVICRREGFPLYLSGGLLLRGWTMVEAGQVAEGIAQIREGIAIEESTGSLIAMTLWLTVLAKAYARAEMFDEGLAQLVHATAIMANTGERYCEAELYRTRGELLRMQGADEVQVEAQFWKAIEVARAQRAKSWELRATMSLARLWRHQGRIVPAREMLGEIYGWFTEGFSSPDPREARALLDELS